MIWLKIIALEKTTYSQSDLSLTPVAILEAAILDGLKVCSTIGYNSFQELLIFLLRPVMSLLYIEVLEVERAIIECDML